MSSYEHNEQWNDDEYLIFDPLIAQILDIIRSSPKFTFRTLPVVKLPICSFSVSLPA